MNASMGEAFRDFVGVLFNSYVLSATSAVFRSKPLGGLALNESDFSHHVVIKGPRR